MQNDVASGYAHRTSRQRASLAARYDREAREVIAAAKAKADAEATAKYVARVRRLIEGFSTLSLRGHKANGDALTRDEKKVIRDGLKDHWKTLRRHGSEFVTVLS